MPRYVIQKHSNGKLYIDKLRKNVKIVTAKNIKNALQQANIVRKDYVRKGKSGWYEKKRKK